MKDPYKDDTVQDRPYFMPKKAGAALLNQYRPEIDVTPELEPVDAAYDQSLIRLLRWMVELGRIDICVEVSMMSSCLALPREGHLKQLFHMFSYLEKNHNSEMVFDHSVPDINHNEFPKQDWSNTVYLNERGELREEVPSNFPPFILWKGICHVSLC